MTTERETFDFDSHWVSEQINNGILGIRNPVLVGIIKFSLPWNLLAGIYTILYIGEWSGSFIYASALGLLWVNIAPALIWYYDERVLPEFFSHLSELVSDKNTRKNLAKKYNEFFAKHRVSVALFWTIAFVTIVYTSDTALIEQGMVDNGAIFMWTTYAYAVYIGAVLGQGFVGPITTLLLIREVSNLELEIDPLHPDNLGGLSNVGYVSIRTTLLFSSGSLFLPLLFFFSSEGGVSTIIFGFTGIYIFTIIVSFIYPTAIVNRRAQEYRDSILEELRQQYAEIEEKTRGPEEDRLSELNKRLELQKVQNKYDNYNSVKLYPLQLSILTRLAGSVILPILFMLFELYLPNII
jgi:hypothetical protein